MLPVVRAFLSLPFLLSPTLMSPPPRTVEDANCKPEDYHIIGVECDVSSERSVQKAYAETVEAFGRIDSVVASAGEPRRSAARMSTPLTPRADRQASWRTTRRLSTCPRV
jgi:NAD(P)-dependent dehydrogenase (short-subunit alcohol dehydrogenase family)